MQWTTIIVSRLHLTVGCMSSSRTQNLIRSRNLIINNAIV